MTDHIIARVKLRRGPGWDVKPNAEQVDGRTLHMTRGWVMDPPSIYAGETVYTIDDGSGDMPAWLAEGDLIKQAE